MTRKELRELDLIGCGDIDVRTTEGLRLIRERDEAQEAAATYHEAWQDAAVYWQAELAERDRLRQALAE